jgi:hypothetical protein
MTDEPNLETVFVSQGPLAAEVAKSKLESQGISALLRYQAIGRVLGLTVDGLGRVEVLVPAKDLARAQQLLAESTPASENDELPASTAGSDPEACS